MEMAYGKNSVLYDYVYIVIRNSKKHDFSYDE